MLNFIYLTSSLICLTTLVTADCSEKEHTVKNLHQKIFPDDASAGADYVMGAYAASIYLYIEVSKTTPEENNDFGCKVALHEYGHVLQQAFLSRQVTSLTPPSSCSLGTNDMERFQILNPGGRSIVPEIFETKIKQCMDSLPASQKLLKVPTYLILIPHPTDSPGMKLDKSIVDKVVPEYMETFYKVKDGCPGVTFSINFMANENNAIAEGEAEYYSESGADGYMKDAMAGWTAPVFDYAADWNQRLTESKNMLAGSPGKAKFLIRSGNGYDMSKLEEEGGWRGNPAGELTYNYLKTVWRTSTTHADIQNIWIGSATKGFAQSFHDVTGSKWSKFVCEMQVHYGVETTCTEDDSWNLKFTDPIFPDPAGSADCCTGTCVKYAGVRDENKVKEAEKKKEKEDEKEGMGGGSVLRSVAVIVEVVVIGMSLFLI